MGFDRDGKNLYNRYRFIAEQSGQYWDPWQGQGASVAQLPDVSDLKTKYIGDKNQFEKLPAEEQNKRVEQFVDEIVARGASPQWGDSLKKRTLYTTQGNENGKFTAVPNVGTLLYNIDNYDKIQSQNNNPQLQSQIQKDPKLQSTYAQPEDMREIVKRMNDPNYQTAVGNLSRQEENEIRTKVDNAQDVTRNEQGELVVKSTGKLLKDIPTKTTSRRYGSNDAAANASNANSPQSSVTSSPAKPASSAPLSDSPTNPASSAPLSNSQPGVVGDSMQKLANDPAVKPMTNLNTPNIIRQAAGNVARTVYNSPQFAPLKTAVNAAQDIYGAVNRENQRNIAKSNAQEAERVMNNKPPSQPATVQPIASTQTTQKSQPVPSQTSAGASSPSSTSTSSYTSRYMPSQPPQAASSSSSSSSEVPWYKKPYNQKSFTATKSY
jgi:hypothetical protein